MLVRVKKKRTVSTANFNFKHIQLIRIRNHLIFIENVTVRYFRHALLMPV